MRLIEEIERAGDSLRVMKHGFVSGRSLVRITRSATFDLSEKIII